MWRGRRSILMKHSVNKVIAAFLLVTALTLPIAPSFAVDCYRRVALDNGIRIALCTPETILQHCTVRDGEGRLIFRLPDGGSYLFIEDTADPAIVNKGDGSFHPMREEDVLGALDEIDVGGRWIGCDIVVYLLPYPRCGFLRSTASGNRIFLSPGVYEPSVCVTAYTVTHEFGHVFQHAYAPTGGGPWETYLRARGIDNDPRYSESSQHRDRPQEIFAEDFRYLFGGGSARYTDSIENPSLKLPNSVEGLEEFFVSLLSPVVASAPGRKAPPEGAIVSSTNYPNPFNPSTTIEFVFDEAAQSPPRNVELSIYRADGSLVRTLYRGSASGAVFRAGWDGRDGGGRAAPSGVYFYRLRSGGAVATGKMMLIR
jgi:hypothetical protein